MPHGCYRARRQRERQVNLRGRARANFPKTLEAARKARDAKNGVYLWRLGDVLIEECGEPGAHGVNTGANDRLRLAQKALKKAGLSYTLRRLEQIRTTAAKFPDRKRFRSVSFEAHREAGAPDVLDRIVKAAPDPTRISVRFVKDSHDLHNQKPPPRTDRAKAATAYENALRAATLAQREFSVFKRIEPFIRNLSAPDLAKLEDRAREAGWGRWWEENVDGRNRSEAAE